MGRQQTDQKGHCDTRMGEASPSTSDVNSSTCSGADSRTADRRRELALLPFGREWILTSIQSAPSAALFRIFSSSKTTSNASWPNKEQMHTRDAQSAVVLDGVSFPHDHRRSRVTGASRVACIA